MSEYAKLAEEFFKHYERPQVDKLTVGYSGIDPQKRVLEYELDHERLNHLQGGDELGHYHLTSKELDRLKILISERFAEDSDMTEYDGGFSSTTLREYLYNVDHWLNGGYSPYSHEKDYDGGEAETW